MNERLQELLENVQRTACQVSDFAVDAAYGMGRKAGEMISVAKMRMRIATLEGSVEECLIEIGQMLYATHTGHPTDSSRILGKLEEIDTLKFQILALQEEIGRQEATGKCPVCGTAARSGDLFCRECGGKL